MNLTKDNFSLEKIKFNRKKGTVEIDCHFLMPDGEQVYQGDQKTKMDVMPHPDLVDQLEKLKAPIATIHGLLAVSALVNRKDFNATKDQIKMTIKERERILDLVEVTGFSVRGEGDKRGIVITGTYDGHAINTKKIYLSADSLGFESELLEVSDAIQDEAWAYLYEGKRSQLSLFESNESDVIQQSAKKGETIDEGV